jgi:hypothetical protein
LSTLSVFLLARIGEREHVSGASFDPRDLQMKRDLIEWALGIDYLVDIADPRAPQDRLGTAVLQILSRPYRQHPSFDPTWEQQ